MSQFEALLDRGGWVMVPLLALAGVAVMLSVERAWFFARHNGPGSRRRVARLGRALREGRRDEARALAEADGSVYGDAVGRLLHERPTEAAAVAAVESQRHRLERFLPLLSTIITAAPMLGILGTVLGLIASFDVFSDRAVGDAEAARDLGAVSRGIAEALTTTAVGLIIAVGALLPYNLFKAQADRTLSRLEGLLTSGLTGVGEGERGPSPPAAAGHASTGK